MIDSNHTIENLKKSKYIYRGVLMIWLMISVFISYNYAKFVSAKYPSGDVAKWGTFVEAVNENISYLPYTSTNDDTKFYQHLLFEPCLEPIIDWAKITYEPSLCDVETSDYQTFRLSLRPDYTRSDGTNLSLKDVYFTYKSILKDNYRDIPSLTSLQNINISIENTDLVITFPEPSVDNMIFFTNFILPEHILANQSFEYYQTSFGSSPIVSACARIQSGENNTQSLIFDLSDCEKYPLKFYQVSPLTINKWDINNPEDPLVDALDQKTIDLTYVPNIDESLTPHSYIQNQFETIFFNTNKISSLALRKNLASYINTASAPSSLDGLWWYIQDHFLYSEIIPAQRFSKASFIDELVLHSNPNKNLPTVQSVATVQNLPSNLTVANFSTTADQPTPFRLPLLDADEKRVTRLQFDTSYKRISVQHNENPVYFPQSYSAENREAIYNFNPTFRNIVEWDNTYVVTAYGDDDTISEQRYFSIVYSETKPTAPIPEVPEPEEEEQKIIPLVFLYFENENNTAIIQHIQEKLKEDKLDMYISFEWVPDQNILEWKLSAGEYDIILRTINMGLRKDLSNIFLTDNLTINPSWFVNEDMARLSKQYFLTKEEDKEDILQKINWLYAETTPILILGKKKWVYYIDSSINNPLPERIYVRGRRRQYLEQLSVFDHISINRSEVFDWDHFLEYLMEA